jgi:hypothetical protein
MGQRVSNRRGGMGRHEWKKTGALNVRIKLFDSQNHKINDGYNKPGSSKKS